MKGLQLAIAIALFCLATLPFVFASNLSCTVTTPGSCSGTIVMYLQNDTGGSTNAHAQNASVATYANVVCCTPTGDTLSLSCEDQIYGRLSSVDNAHFEQNDQNIYSVDQCLSADTEHIVCEYSSTGCAGYDTCLFSYASSDGANVTNSHVAPCSDYSYDVCCTLNDRPVVTTATLNSTSGNNLSEDNLTLTLSGGSDDEGDFIRNITDWRIDNQSIAILNMPFETDIDNSDVLVIRDYSTNENNASMTLTSSRPTTASNCQVGDCLLFNRSQSDELTVSYDASLAPSDGITVSLWVNFNSASTSGIASRQTFISNQYDYAGPPQVSQVGWMLGWKSANAPAQLWWDVSTCQTVIRTCREAERYDWTPVVGTWYHVVGTFDGTVLSLYLDGSLVANRMHSNPGSVFNELSDLVIGDSAQRSGYNFDGYMDELQVFNRALSAEQVASMYQAGLAGERWLELASNDTAGGQNWSVAITPNDGYQDGETIYSNSVFIAAGEVLIEHQPTLVNWTTAHSFNVTAGASYASGAAGITSTTINSSLGSCSELSTSLSGIYYNVTYNCTGTPFTTTNVNISFCDAFDNCATTNTVSNTYPNQAPTMNNLLTPADGNETLIDRLVSFSWEAASDAEGDAVNYRINVTNQNCQDRFAENIGATSYQFAQEFNTSFECTNQNYYWQVQACDAWNCSDYTAAFNFSIQDFLDITILNSEINFSLVALSEGDNTSDDSPAPFLFENSGNIFANLADIQSTGLWSSVALNTSYYQHKTDNSSEPGSFNWVASVTDWLNITATGLGQTLVSGLDYNDSQDSVEIEIAITVPPAEPPGTKSDTLTFVWEST